MASPSTSPEGVVTQGHAVFLQENADGVEAFQDVATMKQT